MIVVFGSITADVVMLTPRLPSAGETVLTDSYLLAPGGKGANQALAAARAGAAVRMIGRIGDDAFAQFVTRNLATAGVELHGLQLSERPTACAAVMVDGDGENQIVVAAGANLTVSIDQLQIQPPGVDDVCLLQLEIPAAANWAAVRLARAAGAQVVLNAAPFAAIPQEVLPDLDVLILNQVEAGMLAAELSLDAGAADHLARRLAVAYDLTAVITLGADGAFAADDKCVLRASALDVAALDTVGAGDAFVGAFTAARAAGDDLAGCLRRGSAAGGLTCLVRGAQDGIPDAAAIAARADEITVTLA